MNTIRAVAAAKDAAPVLPLAPPNTALNWAKPLLEKPEVRFEGLAEVAFREDKGQLAWPCRLSARRPSRAFIAIRLAIVTLNQCDLDRTLLRYSQGASKFDQCQLALIQH
jgi:hypothetical protein